MMTDDKVLSTVFPVSVTSSPLSELGSDDPS